MSKVNVNPVDPKLLQAAEAVMSGDMCEADVMHAQISDLALRAAQVMTAALRAHPEACKLSGFDGFVGIAFLLGVAMRLRIDGSQSDRAEEAVTELALSVIRKGLCPVGRNPLTWRGNIG